MEKTVLLRCPDYDAGLIEQKIREGFEMLGGDAYIRKVIPAGSSVLLKPNLLISEKVGSPALTHCVFFEGVVRVLKDYTTKLAFGDSPGIGSGRKVAERSGMLEVARRYGVECREFKKEVPFSLDNALRCRSWNIAEDALNCDVLITLPKLKTHGMAFFTGAIKNQFGCIVGAQKAGWHTRMPNAHDFCRMLLDLNTVVKTAFAIMDGIVAMQGNGPKSGDPYNLGAIIMGKSLSAVDSVAVRLIGYDDPVEIPALKEAADHSWGAVRPEDIEVLGEKIADLKADDFVKARAAGNFFFLGERFNNLLTRLFAPYPALIKPRCVSCGRCVEVCPETPKAVNMFQGKNGDTLPVWDLKKCIRCFCCQELCPAGAIKIKQTLPGRLLKIK
ncbi:DUF362 domain-containing protein [Lentisphaerota bacterium ZTH]|nr:DUF362 domain-containing protein [Lentisphaerota bacterium]WET06318.1 DUF362 domain-containing protein [Lentisphaerota bacterium ZTH]